MFVRMEETHHDESIRTAVARGESVARIAAELGLSVHAARTRILALGLETPRMARQRENRTLRARGEVPVERVCAEHGPQAFRLLKDGSFRCPRCLSARVSMRRRKVKEILVAEAGGRCALCGYDRCLRALSFHHVDAATKEFGVAARGHSRSLDRARAEVAKCVLLCANCHAEVEAGVASVPYYPSRDRG